MFGKGFELHMLLSTSMSLFAGVLELPMGVCILAALKMTQLDFSVRSSPWALILV